MNEDKVELYCTYDECRNEWQLWYPRPLGGMEVLESFTNEADAKQFWEDQIDSADYDA
ncbi:hypothetical protein [Limnohabitans sp. TS-CS-82]|uniref:hypothetical protein n=1 Tax=Limnohabitans sp. TS-CS-82 TaxID=2094193 RepID=UPI001374AE97|nr:hypothetical protein [Limnohabitans sp. TS-CS-82]